eukprot:CAMPEP_0201661948 /NCGR_PEP_ID=MMETSP0494-20130426/4180_1 /ASSEMBLY_ACC=CAM_ASM_000839 /TAXON_ID=420259 /ORGANISM="Thalassiosira gravida, Strain GMp14c1" /LENGTH=109 /DNA_ID=CAMNT_0048140195 /DNA_START=9 /DNA_END=334 /DNA_ORIENTATION=-
MSSAAERAARTLGSSSRNRPSRQMSASSFSLRASSRSAGDSSREGGSGGGGGLGGSGYSDPSNNDNNASNRSGGGGSLFMDDVKDQYESLSEKLAKENAASSSTIASAT